MAKHKRCRVRHKVSCNPRKRRHGKNRGMRGIFMNPMLDKVKAGFNVKHLSDAGIMAGGALVNSYVAGKVIGYLPSFAQNAVGRAATGLLTAGILSGVSGAISPRLAGPVLSGAILQTFVAGVNEFRGGSAPVNPRTGVSEFYSGPEIQDTSVVDETNADDNVTFALPDGPAVANDGTDMVNLNELVLV